MYMWQFKSLPKKDYQKIGHKLKEELAEKFGELQNVAIADWKSVREFVEDFHKKHKIKKPKSRKSSK